MAWKSSYGTIDAGVTIRVSFSWGAYNGVQTASVMPTTMAVIPLNVELTVTDPSVAIVSPSPGAETFVYSVTIRNSGANRAFYQLVGGAVV
jgi:hypothetical protein